MTAQIGMNAFVDPNSTIDNVTQSIAVLRFSVICDTAELAQGVTDVIRTALKPVELAQKVEAESIPMDKETTKSYLTYSSYFPVNRWIEVQTFFQEFAADLLVDATKFNFPPEAKFVGAQCEIMDNPDQSEEASVEQFHHIQSHLLSKTFEQAIRLNGLRHRIAEMEKFVIDMSKEQKSIDEYLRGSKVLNFEYRAMHSVPAILYSIIEKIGADDVKKKFENFFEEGFPDAVTLH